MVRTNHQEWYSLLCLDLRILGLVDCFQLETEKMINFQIQKFIFPPHHKLYPNVVFNLLIICALHYIMIVDLCAGFPLFSWT